jgi:hypothetical protein
MHHRSTDGHEEVLVQSPAWVRDAVFYQIFPDRLARSGRVPAPGELEPWEAEPTTDGFKGGDLGSSAAQSVVLMFIVITLTVVQFRYVEKKVNYS